MLVGHQPILLAADAFFHNACRFSFRLSESRANFLGVSPAAFCLRCPSRPVSSVQLAILYFARLCGVLFPHEGGIGGFLD